MIGLSELVFMRIDPGDRKKLSAFSIGVGKQFPPRYALEVDFGAQRECLS
tara:strand:+ start:45 stop:194 length:150 start_codon:yes stop_codon:yes gene_type:complete